MSSSAAESFRELTELARSAGAEIVAEVFQVRPIVDAATLMGHGKVEELKELAEALRADVLIVDHELSPTQQRNLEKATAIKVIDRTQLILDIFAHRARTAEGRLQVELAQLKYMLPRLAGQGTSLSRLGGGIGTRGPGETKLETDRRRIATRIKKLETNIERVRTGRALHRENRDSVPVPVISLAGYTNAGKSTLFNRLTSSDVLADAKMFATLDPTVRGLQLPSHRNILLSDTVGFVRNLLTTLIHAFRATLEEVADAALILHVVDASSPEAGSHIAEVFRVLGEIGAKKPGAGRRGATGLGASGTPQILVLNKADCLPEGERNAAILGARLLGDAGQSMLTPAVMVSGLTGEGVGALLDLIDKVVPFDSIETAHFRIPLRDGAAIALLHSRGRVRAEDYDGNLCEIEADAPESLRRRLKRYLIKPPPKPGEPVENSVKK